MRVEQVYAVMQKALNEGLEGREVHVNYGGLLVSTDEGFVFDDEDGEAGGAEPVRLPVLGDIVIYRAESGDRPAIISKIHSEADAAVDLTVFGPFSSSVISELYQGLGSGQWRFR